MSDIVSVSWLNNHQQIQFDLGSHTRFLNCPDKRKKQFGENKYFFDKETIATHHIRCFDKAKNQKTHYEVSKRIWSSFWTEGWRGI